MGSAARNQQGVMGGIGFRTKKTDLEEQEDFYPTPPWVTKQLLKYVKFKGDILEPACGDGAISKVLEKANFSVTSTDLIDRGYGKSGKDFLKRDVRADNIVTNPPYGIALPFILKALTLSKRKTAMLMRLGYLSSHTRYTELWEKYPPPNNLVLCRASNNGNSETSTRSNASDEEYRLCLGDLGQRIQGAYNLSVDEAS